MDTSVRLRALPLALALYFLLLGCLAACGTSDVANARHIAADRDADLYEGPQADAGEADAGEADAGEADAGEADAGEADASPDADAADSGLPSWTEVPADRPLRLAFIGNSFTFFGLVPRQVWNIAASVGWPKPEVRSSIRLGETLSTHRTDEGTLNLVDSGNWDFVVLQGHSLSATDNAGDPTQFKDDVTWFYDRIKTASPEAQVVLFETWAYHSDHSIYTDTFAGPAEMQAQIRFHYNDTANHYIPTHTSFSPSTDVRVAPVGDAWEYHLGLPNALRLHSIDREHAQRNGQYLSALVIYSTIYGVVSTGAAYKPLLMSSNDAAALQTSADETTGITP